MNNIIKRTWNQGSMVNIEDLRGMTFQAESGGHTFVISAIDADGNAVSLSGTPAGTMLRPDNTDQALTCSVSGGKVYATLPAGCYDVPGRAGITIFLTSDGQKTAIYAAVVSISRTQSGTVAPGTTASVVDLINAINAAINSIPASYSSLLADIAPNYSNSALYSVGQYAWYDGDLKRCIVPITTAESYTAAHWTSAVLGRDVSDLKSALKRESPYVHAVEGNKALLYFVWQYGFVSDGNVTESSVANPNRFTPNIFRLEPSTVVLNAYTGTSRSTMRIWLYNADGTYANDVVVVHKNSSYTVNEVKYCRFSLEIDSGDATADFDPNKYIYVRAQNRHNIESKVKNPYIGLKDGKQFLEFIWSYGYIDGSGNKIESTFNNPNRMTENSFILPKGTEIYNLYNGSNRNALYIRTYNEDGTYSGTAYTVYKNTVKILDEDTICRFSFEIESTDATIEFDPNKYIYVYTKSDIVSLIGDILGENNKPSYLNWHYGFINGSTGQITPSTFANTNRYSDEFFLNAGSIIKNTYSSVAIIYKYNGTQFVGAGQVGYGARFVLEYDGVYRINLQISSNDATPDFDPGQYIEITENYQSEASVLSQKIADLESALSGSLISVPFIWNWGYVDGNGNISYSSYTTRNRFTFLVFIPMNAVITTLSTGGNCYIYRYTSDGTFVGRETILSAHKIYTVPSDGYFRFSYETGSNDPTFYPSDEISAAYSKKYTSDNFWIGKKIVWFGTSIPAGVINAGEEMGNGSYPVRIGNMLGATVYNEAQGSSCARIGMHGSISQDDPNGYAGVPATCALYSLGATRAEKQAILDNWDYWKNIFTVAVSDIDPTQPDQYLNASYETKLDRYLTGGSVGPVDFYVFDHGYNDGGNGNGWNYSDITDVPTDSRDRTYFIGAMNFLIDRILTSNRQAQIIIVAHYNDEGVFSPLVQAQKYIADKWNLPFVATYENMGFTTSATITIDGTTKTMKDWWMPDGIHPASDPTGAAMKHYAEVLYPMIRNLR